MAKFRNETGSFLHSQEFGALPPGEFEAEGYDPEVHGVIPGCTWLDEPKATAKGSKKPAASGDGDKTKADDGQSSEQDKEAAK